jgi:hypothetical protein
VGTRGRYQALERPGLVSKIWTSPRGRTYLPRPICPDYHSLSLFVYQWAAQRLPRDIARCDIITRPYSSVEREDVSVSATTVVTILVARLRLSLGTL